MSVLLKGGFVLYKGTFIKADISIVDGRVTEIGRCVDDGRFTVVKCDNYYVLPGFVDVHVHLREPGFSYKETIATGTQAAARGGYTTVCAMPNLSPVPDCVKSIEIENDIIKRDALISVLPYASITKGEKGQELSDIDELAEYAVGFSDDGHGVENKEIMEEAMVRVKKNGKFISAHCEDMTLVNGGYINECAYAKSHGHRGISAESEYKQIERDIALVAKTGCRYHVCHISTKESAELIRKAKRDNLPVTCETTPHYLLLCDDMLTEDARFKMNPPLRSRNDMLSLREALLDGTIDAIATDHAPHSLEEKSRGLEKSLMGITGLETAYAVLYTGLVKTGIIPFELLCNKLTASPASLIGIKSEIEVGYNADITIVDNDERFIIDSKTFASMGKSTPFDGNEVYGKVKYTLKNGRIVWNAEI